MEAGWLARARWRRRGAWLWPTFVATAVLDGIVAATRPFVGDSQSFYGGLLAGLILNLLAVLLLSPAVGRVLRRRRGDMPTEIARNYAGTIVVATITGLLLASGVVRHGAIVDRRQALRDAVVRAEAYIGDHAPREFRVNAYDTNTYVIESGLVYRTCVASRYRNRYYCVVVRPRMPASQSVKPAGSEPNQSLSLGTD